MIILCFDPGLTTGWCLFDEGDHGMKLVKCGHCHNVKDVIDTFEMDEVRYEMGFKFSVAEAFARGNSVVKEQILTLRMCGAIEVLALEHGCSHTEQYPAQRTGYVPIAKTMIKELGFGTLKENHHAIDAIAHGLCYMDNNNIEWQKRWWMKVTFDKEV